jgi:hypothetical protein
MDTSIYDSCFLITSINNIFRVVGIQTDDIIILGNKWFLVREKQELVLANYTTKPKKN